MCQSDRGYFPLFSKSNINNNQSSGIKSHAVWDSHDTSALTEKVIDHKNKGRSFPERNFFFKNTSLTRIKGGIYTVWPKIKTCSRNKTSVKFKASVRAFYLQPAKAEHKQQE